MHDGNAANGEVVIAAEITAECAITCQLEPNDSVRTYVEAGIAQQGGPIRRTSNASALGAGTYQRRIFSYLAEQATTLKVATLMRRLAAISIAHKAQRLPSPVSSP